MPARSTPLSRRRVLFGLTGLAAALLPSAVGASPLAPVTLRPIAPPRVTPPPPGQVPPAETAWLQTHTATTVWADPDGTRALAPAPQWTYFRMLGTQQTGRIAVHDPRTGAPGWVDAGAVGPSGPPPPAPAPSPVVPAPAPAAAAAPSSTSPAPPQPSPPAVSFEPFWVAPFRPTALLMEPRSDSTPITSVPQFAPLTVTGPAQGDFYPVEEPFSKVGGWIEATALGRVGQPEDVPAARWWGKVVVDEAFARAEPTRSAPIVARYPRETLLGIAGWVEGDQVVWDDPAWGEVAPGVYVYGRLTRPLPIEAPPPLPRTIEPPAGRWIGINRTVQLVTAYEGTKPLFWARTSTGRPGWETRFGAFEIFRRVANETMDSATLLGRDAERAQYRIENIRFTQYFTYDGNALHENWWKEPDTFGLPSSHGCAGLRTEDAERFWEFGTIGTPVLVHP